MGHRIGFVGTRFAGTDGVSLESAKWAQVLWDHKHVSHWYAGKLDRDAGTSMLVDEAFFGHPDNQWINDRVWGRMLREPVVTQRIYDLAAHLKETLYEFIGRFDIEYLVVENALCLPMHIPLGVALTQLIAERGMPTVAHHHDFYWERSRFAVNAVSDILAMAFPPQLPPIQHVTINSFAQQDLSWRRGAASLLVPNVLDFESPVSEPHGTSAEFRADLGLAEDDILFLQPTRVVPRKGIEHSIALLAQLGIPNCKLLVSHETGDEGDDYRRALQDMAEQEGVDMRFIDSWVGDRKTSNGNGSPKKYDLADAYAHADFITYPSLYEGFGNALLEAFYFSKPVLVNRYSIFINDIEPKGFRVITMDGYLTRETVNKVRRVIEDAAYRDEMVRHNHELGKSFFSYSVLRRKLRALITNFSGLDDL
mgnify:CR=1 FL=1